MDDLTKEQRHKNMSHIRSINSKPEEKVRKFLFSQGLRYRKNVRTLPGCPDIVLPKYKTVVFINGCFWHRHKDCKYAYMPKSRVEFWKKKFRNNMERDTVVRHQLQEEGVRMLIIWECTVKSMIKDTILRESVLDRIDSFMRSGESYLEL